MQITLLRDSINVDPFWIGEDMRMTISAGACLPPSLSPSNKRCLRGIV